MLCEAMKWSHLPSDGGMMDQKAGLLDRFYYIFAERSKAEEAERAKKEAEQGRKSRGGKGMRLGASRSHR